MEQELWKTLVAWLDSGAPCALATVVRTGGSAPRHSGAKMLVGEDGRTVGTVGGGALEAAVIEEARAAIRAGEPRFLAYRLQPDLGMACGGSADLFVEPLLPPDRLYIFGAGHVGQALAPLASRIGFSVTVVDDRPELVTPERFPTAVRLMGQMDPAAWNQLIFDERTFCVVVTRSHQTDTEVVRALLDRTCPYVGMIGSPRKRAALETTLKEAGISEQRIAQLRTPIGEPIEAETPEEIAVSIAAQLIKTRRSSARGGGSCAGGIRPRSKE
jgi:xanthine dehydrogenase accessory factor